MTWPGWMSQCPAFWFNSSCHWQPQPPSTSTRLISQFDLYILSLTQHLVNTFHSKHCAPRNSWFVIISEPNSQPLLFQSSLSSDSVYLCTFLHILCIFFHPQEWGRYSLCLLLPLPKSFQLLQVHAIRLWYVIHLPCFRCLSSSRLLPLLHLSLYHSALQAIFWEFQCLSNTWMTWFIDIPLILCCSSLQP